MVLVNAANLSSGGGFTVLEQFYIYSPEECVFLVNNNEIRNYLLASRENGPKILVVPPMFLSGCGVLLFYGYWVDWLARKYNAVEILSLGNVPSRTALKQKVYLQWAYYVYGFNYSNGASIKEIMSRALRYALIRAFSRYVSVWVVQTATMRKRLKEKLNNTTCKDVFYVYPGFVDLRYGNNINKFLENKESLRLIYPALYYSHKNFSAIRKIADQIESQGMTVSISLTLPPEKFTNLGFNSTKVVSNLGVLTQKELTLQYLEHDALLMPTKLETVGLPYLEAMSIGLPILTSDLDFSREICGEAALYFDPDDAFSIVSAIKDLQKNSASGGGGNQAAAHELKKFSSWKESVRSVFNV
ncbi:glycosyltransferase [Billgrantia aerodenitrificans]|uniref:Glycosyltransferase n=1 Tax=Billgrantia aerodenitrificans TaxID=2733483 RepID=A0ABS9AVG5_9GAMM|nr:glycosyltransferase [Halomonas aerodenitrificans]MCE8025741.1 glycosyltransferase [Halomonas aerodenitrificans]